MKLTIEQFNRTLLDFRQIIGNECGKLEFRNSKFWFFGSEFATLRLLAKYREVERARVGYSENLQTHYFTLELPEFTGEFPAVPTVTGILITNPPFSSHL